MVYSLYIKIYGSHIINNYNIGGDLDKKITHSRTIIRSIQTNYDVPIPGSGGETVRARYTGLSEEYGNRYVTDDGRVIYG